MEGDNKKLIISLVIVLMAIGYILMDLLVQRHKVDQIEFTVIPDFLKKTGHLCVVILRHKDDLFLDLVHKDDLFFSMLLLQKVENFKEQNTHLIINFLKVEILSTV